MKRYFCIFTLLLMASLTRAADRSTQLCATVAWHDFSPDARLTHLSYKTMSMNYVWNSVNSIRIEVASREVPFTQLESEPFLPYDAHWYAHAGISYFRSARFMDNVRAHIGGGPAMHVSSKKDGKERKDIFDKYNVGPAVSCGVGLDYFLKPNIAIRCEYITFYQFGLNVNGSYQEYTDDHYQTVYYKNHTTFIDSFCQVGFSFYF